MAKDDVTLRDILAVQERMAEMQSRIEAKIDDRFEKIDKRVTSIESFQNKALGVLSLFSVFASSIATFVWNRLINKGQ